MELINLENTNITTYSQKFFKQIQKHKIKIILDQANLKQRFRKKVYQILLGGSFISGKTCYLTAYIHKKFDLRFLSTIGLDYRLINYKKLEA